MNDKNMQVLISVIGAVESGGQVYGKQRYDAYADPYKNSPNEHTITLGWAQNYGNNARKLVQMIYDKDPAAFLKLDTGGIAAMLKKNWVSIRWKPTTTQKKALIALISSPNGRICQDELFKEGVRQSITDCEQTFTHDVRAVMMYCEIRHLGGKGPADRIFKRLGGDYSLDAIMASLVKDQRDKSSSNQVGDAIYWSRHVKCRQFIEEYATPEDGDGDSKDEETEEVETVGITADQIIATYRSWIGLSRPAGTHKKILDIYNGYIRSHPGSGRGYQVSASDAFCDATFSAAFIANGAVDLIKDVECGVEEHVKIFKQAGIWEENGSITPKPGYGIIYNWDSAVQPNDGYSDHIGIVSEVANGYITCIEGNMSGGVVGTRKIPVGWGYIRGFVKPKYAVTPAAEKSEKVETGSAAASVKKLNETPKWTGVITDTDPNGAAVRTWAGTENPTVSFSGLKKGTQVEVCDTIKAKDSTDWYFIRYNNKYGFISAALVGKAEAAGTAATPAEEKVRTATYGASIGPDKSVAGKYVVTADALNIRNRAGTMVTLGSTILGSIPKGTEVRCYGFYSIVKGARWLYIQVKHNGITYTGHCSAAYLRKV